MVDMKYYFDKCGERIAIGNRASYRPATGAKRHDPAIDLCAACEAEFRKWLGPPPGRKAKANDAA